MAQLVIAWTGVVAAFAFGIYCWSSFALSTFDIIKLAGDAQIVAIALGSLSLLIAYAIAKSRDL